MKNVEVSDFPKLPKGYTWKVKYEAELGQHSIGVSIVRFGVFTRVHKWSSWPIFEFPTPEEIRRKGVWLAESSWSVFTGTSLGDKRLDAAKALQDELNSGSLREAT